MIKCFLSHSSKDKLYVSTVAEKLGLMNCVYDEYSFEEGALTSQEIEKKINESCLFVIFLSRNSITSNWVNIELEKAFYLLNKGIIKRIYPVIIDQSLTYDNKEIPAWLKANYNLKYISSPKATARRIKEKLSEISWEIHPNIRNRIKIFVGRNDLIKKFEERLDSFDIPKPTAIIASGLDNIGRRSLIKHCLMKANIIPDTYDPPLIYLDSHESIEDFLIKMNDLGFSENINLDNLIAKKVEEKIEIANLLVQDIQKIKEIIFIKDNGCLITSERNIAAWFLQLLNNFKSREIITFAIASTKRIQYKSIRNDNSIFYLETPELDINERRGLLKRYSEFENLPLLGEDLHFISGLLVGYPEQVFFAVKLIQDIGITRTKKEPYLIVDYASQKVTRLLQKFEENRDAMYFLYFLSEYDFMKYEFLNEIVGDDQVHKLLFDEFISSAIIEFFGASREYLRVNNTVRDYIKRNKLEISEKYQRKIEEHLEKFLLNYQGEDEEKDASDILNTIKTALLNGKKIDPKYLIPSHFVKTMKELYDHDNKYEDVVKLADTVLVNSEFLDENIVFEIRYYLCSSLARLRDKQRFWEEMQKINTGEYDFLAGFFYRIQGNYPKALECQLRFLEQKRESQRAKREIVQIYLQLEDYPSAYDLAKENYENDKNNPYHIQAYFNCIVRSSRTKENGDLLRKLLLNLFSLKSERAREMYSSCEAEYTAFWENNEAKSLNIIDDAIMKNRINLYYKFTKINICDKFNKQDLVQDIIEDIEKNIETNNYQYRTLIKYKARYYFRIGKPENAIRLLENKHFDKNIIDLFKERFGNFHPA